MADVSTNDTLYTAWTQLSDPERLSDVGDAALVEAQYHTTLKHGSDVGWLAYKAGKWDDTDGKKEAARAVVATLHREAEKNVGILGSKAGRELYSHLHTGFNRSSNIRNVLGERQAMSVRASQLDTHHDLLNCTNGVVDLRTGIIRPHDPDLYLTKQTNAAYLPEAQCPQWLSFLDDIFLGDKELVDWVQRLLGYTLSARTDEQAFILLYGEGKNGKTTFLETIGHIMGDYAVTVAPELFVHRGGQGKSASSASPELAWVDGARLVWTSEPDNPNEQHPGRLASATVKRLTGSDSLTARKLYCDPYQFTPRFTPMLAANRLPRIEEDTEGIWRRVKAIPFDAKFEGARRVGDMQERLKKEADGILAWMVAGAVRWYAADGSGKLGDPPKAMTTLQADYRAKEDAYYPFFATQLVPEEGAEVSLVDAYEAFRAWGKRHADEIRETLRLDTPTNHWGDVRPLPVISDRKFNQMVKDRGFTKVRRNSGFVLAGVRLRREAQPAEDVQGSVGSVATVPLNQDSSKKPSIQGLENDPLQLHQLHATTEEPRGPKIVPVLTPGTLSRRRTVRWYGRPVIEGEPLVTVGCRHPHAERLAIDPDAWENDANETRMRCPDCFDAETLRKPYTFLCGDVAGHRTQWDALGCPLCDGAFAVRWKAGEPAREAARAADHAAWLVRKAQLDAEEAERRRAREAKEQAAAEEALRLEAEQRHWDATLKEWALDDTARWIATWIRNYGPQTREAMVYYAAVESKSRIALKELGPVRPAADVLETLYRMDEQGALVPIIYTNDEPAYALCDELQTAAGSLLYGLTGWTGQTPEERWANRDAPRPTATPKHPASDKQKALLLKLGFTGDVETLDIRAASHAIDWLMHKGPRQAAQMAEAEDEVARRLRADDEDEEAISLDAFN